MMGDRSKRSWYQFYNPTHHADLIKLFQNARPLHWVEAQANENGINTHSVDEPFDDYYSDVDNNTEDRVSNDDPVTSLGSVGLSCTTCDLSFANVLQQRQHFKLDFHRHNIKRRENGQKPIGETEFVEIMDGLSSISGSDSEDEDSAIDTSSQLSRIIEKVTVRSGASSSPERSAILKPQAGTKSLVRSPKVFFENDKNEVIALYQTALPSPKSPSTEDATPAFDIKGILTSPRKLGVVMVSGGHFAAGVFEGNKEVLHKTIHKYTVRAKQGGSQSRADNKSGGSGPKSAGASLRRHNELSLTNEIQTLLKSWESEFNQCQWIFYRVGGSNQQLIFGTKSDVFQKGNPRLRTIPFPTKRPTFSEVKKVVSQLTSVQVYQREEFLRRFLPSASRSGLARNSKESQAKSPEKHKKKKNIDRGRSRSPKTREVPGKPVSPDEASDSELNVDFVLEECPTELNLRNELQEYDDSLTQEERRGKRKPRSKNLEKVKIEPWGIAAEILGVMMNSELEAKGEVNPLERPSEEHKSKLMAAAAGDLEALGSDLNQRVDAENSTVLHVAVKKNSLDVVWFLLEYGSDPSLKDKSGKYPYNWSPSKECRTLFRRFRGKFPEKYDYQKAQIPSPLTDEMEQEIAEKKKIQNKLKREKEKQKRVERKEKDEEAEQQKRFLNLSDREKRALAADRRLLGQCKEIGEVKPVLLRCFDCAADITGKVPFEYNQNKFCSTRCLASHRKKFPTPLSV